VHQREEVSREPWIVFPGNIQGRHIRETGAKGCILVTVEDGAITEVRHHDLDVLRWSRCEVDIGVAVDDSDDEAVIDALLSRVAAALQQTLDAADDRPVAVRLVLTGSSPVHSRLQSEREHWEQELRALASGLGGAGLWLEKLVLRTRAPRSAAEIAALSEANDEALGGLLATLQTLKQEPADGDDESGLSELAGDFTSLGHKLPIELRNGPDPFDPGAVDTLRAALDDVEDLLVSRLLGTGPGQERSR